MKETGGAWSGGEAPQPLTLAGAGNPSVIAGSKDTAGKAKGAREVSCSHSRWPKSACHEEQGDGSPVPDLYPWHAIPRIPRRPWLGLPRPCGPRPGQDTCWEKPEPQNCPRRAQCWQGLTSEPRTGLGPCSLSLGELHPDAGVLLLLGEESESWREREVQSGAVPGDTARPLLQDSQVQLLPSWASCFLP